MHEILVSTRPYKCYRSVLSCATVYYAVQGDFSIFKSVGTVVLFIILRKVVLMCLWNGNGLCVGHFDFTL